VNKMKNGTKLIAVVMVLSMIAGITSAGPCKKGMEGCMEKGRPGECLEKILAAADEIGMTDVQIEQAKGIIYENSKIVISKHSEIQLKRLDLALAMDQDKPDRAKITTLVKEIGVLEVDIKLATIIAKLDINELLNDEQKAKMNDFRRGMQCGPDDDDEGDGPPPFGPRQP
jgi:Spy/CpxP family protein refolding chaperone